MPVNVEPYSGEWLDIGRPDDYIRAIESFEENRERLLPCLRAERTADL
jgi:NDP-sugar pyrophosphorylase family protein